MSLADEPNSIPQIHPSGERRAELERIRDAVWPPNESTEERKARIARNVAAWEEAKKLPKPKLTAEQWNEIDQASILGENEA